MVVKVSNQMSLGRGQAQLADARTQGNHVKHLRKNINEEGGEEHQQQEIALWGSQFVALHVLDGLQARLHELEHLAALLALLHRVRALKKKKKQTHKQEE